jgi:hypothetical protein
LTHLCLPIVRSLGLHAWEIASSCATLPYFPHSLELLLHEVLEEEATSSHAIPDPLLPRVVDFIREFPFFLETVAHCARKTELALWPHLFAVVGAPVDLYQKCVNQERLHTAASYIVVLHNLDPAAGTCKAHATELLEAATIKGHNSLVKDLVRFLNAIEPSVNSPANTSGSDGTPAQRKSVTRMESAHVPAPGQLTNPLQLQTKSTISDASTPMRIRTQSSGSSGTPKDAVPNGHTPSLTNGSAVNIPTALATEGKESYLKSKSPPQHKAGNGALPGKVWPIGERSLIGSSSAPSDDSKQMNGTALSRSVSNASSNHRDQTLTSNRNSNKEMCATSRRHSLSDTSLLNASSCRLQ